MIRPISLIFGIATLAVLLPSAAGQDTLNFSGARVTGYFNKGHRIQKAKFRTKGVDATRQATFRSTIRAKRRDRGSLLGHYVITESWGVNFFDPGEDDFGFFDSLGVYMVQTRRRTGISTGGIIRWSKRIKASQRGRQRVRGRMRVITPAG